MCKQYIVGYFAHFNLLTMYTFLLNRLIATVIVCSLFLLQSCRSGLRAITEESVLKQDHPTTADHVQASGEASSLGVLVPVSPRTDARVSGVLGRMSPAESVAAVFPLSPQFFAGPFTASSGERVLLSQQQGQWQAVLQGSAGTMMHRRTLPVVSSGDVGTLLAGLQGQDAWSSRSRIHVLSASHRLSTPCVYVGKLVVSPAEEEWCSGPRLEIKGGGKTSVAVFLIPSDYRCKDYRVKEEVLENPSALKIYYVAANNEEEVRELENLENGRFSEENLGVDINLPFGQVFTLGSLEVSTKRW
jgi:hypothetical protein